MRSQRSLSKGTTGSLSRACDRSGSGRSKAVSPSIASVLKTWISDNQAQGFSAKTIKERQWFIERFVWWLENEAGEEPTLDSLNAVNVRAFLTYVREPHPTGRWGCEKSYARRETKPLTVFAYFRELRAFSNFCIAEGFLEDSPLKNVKRPKVVQEQVRPFTQEQIQALLAACGETTAPERNRAIILMLLDTGLRVSELCSLRRADVKANTTEITVIGKGGKERSVYLGKTARRALRLYLVKTGRVEDDQPLFLAEGGYGREGLTPQGIRFLMKDLQGKSGVEGVRVSPHTLRHSFAISFLRAGGNLFELQRLMGHSDLAVLRKYVALSQSDLAKAHRQASPADTLKLR